MLFPIFIFLFSFFRQSYIYTGTLTLSNLTTSEIIHLLEATDELAFDELFSHVQEYLITQSSEYIEQNLHAVTDMAFKHETFTTLQTYCINLITKDPRPFFYSTKFLSTDESILIAILSRDDINIEEITIWIYLIQWGLHNSSMTINTTNEIEYKNFGEEEFTLIDFTSLKTTLSPLLPLVRFSDISSEDYETKVKPFQSILSPNLPSALSWRYTFEDNEAIKLNLTSRKPPYHINSTLINRKHAALIANWIDPNEGNYNVNGKVQFGKIRFNLLYRGSKHQFSFKKFHKMCDNQGPTLVLIKTQVNNNNIDLLHVHYAIPHASGAYMAKQILAKSQTNRRHRSSPVARDRRHFRIPLL